jgi:hypothetical protein
MFAAMRLRFSAQRLRALWPYLLVAFGASVPAWIVRHPPVQDLPYHLATIRVLHSFHDPAFGFAQHFQLQLGRTEYLLYYVAGSALAYVLGVVYANVVLVSAYFAGTVLAVRALVSAMGRDPRVSLFVVPLLVNVLFIYGLLPFLLGIPLMFWGLAVVLRHFERPTWGRGVLLAFISVALFYSHIIPFGLFGLGFAALFPWGRAGRWLSAGLPTAPVLGLLAWWMTCTDAGRTTRGLMTGGEAGSRARELDASIADIPNWFANVFQDDTDERWLIAYAVLVVVTVALRMGDKESVLPRARRYAVVPIACVLLYFATPVGHDFIWPLAQRFAILFALTAVPLLGMPRGARGVFVTAGAVLVAAGVTVNTARHFMQFQLEEVGDLDQALAVMPPAQKVCALIFDRGSRVTHHQPFIHFGSYYQVEKGGVVMFTFAGYPHWPFDFQPGKYPPPGGPARRRWEWTPERVGAHELTPYYDYVLVRGSGFRPGPDAFRRIYDGSRWSVWERASKAGTHEESNVL